MLNSRLNLVNVTVAACAVLLVLCLFWATTETNDILTACATVAAFGFAVVLAFLHLVWAVVHRGERLKHFGLAGLIAVIVAGLPPVCANRHISVLRRAFLEKRLPQYEAMAASILEHRANLTDRYSDVSNLVRRPQVYAWTNRDASVSIRFYGFVNGGMLDATREIGYLYHNGPVVTKPDDTNYCLLPRETSLAFPRYHLHLTNHWYEY